MAAMAAILDFRSEQSYFRSTSHPNASYQVLSQLTFQFRRRSENGCHGGHLGFLMGTILAILDLQVTLMLPTKFKVNKQFGSGEEVKNRFSRWQPWRPSWISNRNNFSHFCSISHPDVSYQVSSQLAFGFRRRGEKYIFKMAAMVASLDFQSAQF